METLSPEGPKPEAYALLHAPSDNNANIIWFSKFALVKWLTQRSEIMTIVLDPTVCLPVSVLACKL